jgi:hypothetical protein
MYVYCTESFKTELERQGLGSGHFQTLCGELERMTPEQVRSRFETIYPFLKRKEANLRLIAQIRRVERDFVLCWLQVFQRGGHEYEHFLHHREVSVKVSHEQLSQWLQQQKAERNHTPPKPLPLPPELQIWLQRPDWSIDLQGTIIYESQVWLRRFSDPAIQHYWSIYYGALLQLVDAQQPLGIATAYPGVWQYETEGRAILYSKLGVTDAIERPVLFLIVPFASSPTPEDVAAIMDAIAPPLTPQNGLPPSLTLDRLTAWASRAYPDYLLAAAELWRALEDEASANLALSAEEEGILHAVSTRNPSLPLFLNGQAGSGKSTLLFYLFADYCHRHFSQTYEHNRDPLAQPHPLFLAYNHRLLAVAREKVTLILTSHHRFLEARNTLPPLPDLSPFFQCFRTFLRDLLPLEQRDRFNDANYVSFHRFRQLLKRQRLSYSPEQCWQTIRTFIKGYLLDERDVYLEIEDYEDIPKAERTIPVEMFQAIYHSVWHWYKNYTQERQLWDDQDLVRAVLKLGNNLPKYTAIFCDEAQDFTRLELQAIMRLSVLYDYDLEHHYVESLPFAFAGDPLQTLNPTGFRWESLKATFHNEVIATLFPTGSSHLKMNFQELECNYRSINAIVGVSNLIQLWRRSLFNLNDLKPQKSRKSGHFEPQKFILGQDILAAELHDILQNTITIIPCDEGGEADYIHNDSILSSFYETNGITSDRAWNILSAIAAKGLEFKQVVLYKFGEVCPSACWQKNDDPAEAVNYFFNKLYVAVSRATERLLIIDTEKGENRLWYRASNAEELDEFLMPITPEAKQGQWRDRVCLIRACDPTTLVEADDLAAIAQTFESQGIETENPEFLRRAKGAYQRLNDSTKLQFCEALALKFEGELMTAGQLFQAQENWQQAWDCFWQAMAWQELLSLRDRVAKIEPVQAAIIDFMAAPSSDKSALEAISNWLAKEAQSQHLETYHSHAQFLAAIHHYSQTIQAAIAQPATITKQSWLPLGRVLQQLATAKYQNMAELAVKCFYLAGDYEQVVTCAEANSAIQSQEYYLAKAEVTEMPETLIYLSQAQAYERLIQLWKQAHKPRDRDWLVAVAFAYEQTQNYNNALVLYSWLNNLEKVKTCFHAIQPTDALVKALQFVLKYYIQAQHWQDAIATIETHLDLLTQPDRLKLNYIIARNLATSTLSPNRLDSDLRQRYETFLVEQIVETDWQRFLPLQQVGVALEKIGSLVKTLTFYEQFVDDSTFARDRWLATKLRQAQYYRDTGALSKAEKATADATKKAQRWGIVLTDVTLTPPDVSDAVVSFSHAVIENLPDGIVPQTSDRGVTSFHCDRLEVRVKVSTQQVLITDLLSNQSLRIEARSRTIKVGTFRLQSPNGDAIHFDDRDGNYRGILYVASPHPRVELFLPDCDRSVMIHLG